MFYIARMEYLHAENVLKVKLSQTVYNFQEFLNSAIKYT